MCSFRRIQKRNFDPRFAGFCRSKERGIRNCICNLCNLSQTRAICMTASQEMTCFLLFDKLCDYIVQNFMVDSSNSDDGTYIENTSWKVLTYGISTWVVSEISLVRCAHSFDFWYKNKEWVNTVRSTLHVVLCLLYTYWDSHHFGGLFILNLSKMLKFAATHHQIAMKTKYQLFSRNVS